ncbi:cellulose biosynthesis cyclic di-GMP-binding regulatory protein BcsB [Methylobacterium sp. sgz302541]|uniref:cellulose biosynthesis cyclic di-GMP-binding regulatory protein BcsB n=1 Tax=unclassified Methylobacterium TaxID=2615210 RepID=UPI003D32FEDE
MRSASRLVPLPALAAGLLCAASAMAQTFSGFGPAGPLVLPKTPDAARPAAVAAEPAAPTETVRDPVLRRLPSVATPLRLWGENGDIVWAFYATEAEARTGGRFQIGYRAAVSVLPEVSRLTLRINGTVIGEDPIEGARGLRTVSFDVPPGALSRGFNAVRVTMSQRHRVDCSVAATYELWTQIDPDATGFASAASGLGEPGDIAGARVSADGAVPIRLIQAGERLSEREVERLLGALQDTVLAGRFAQPSADFGPSVPGGDGLALAVGPADQLARALDLAPLGPVSGPRLALLPRAAGRRPVLVATGASESDVARSLAELRDLHAGPPPGTPLGLLALADAGGRRIEGGEVVALGDVGMADAHVTAGTHRIGVDLALPHDVLVADYDRLTLELDGSYAAGLAEGAQIAVAINGVSAGSTPLARPGGESFRRRAMFLPLRLLRPGLNRVTITAELPREEDKDCRAEASAPRERLTLLATTRLRIPPLARIARQPDLAGTLGAGFPYAQGQRRTMLSVPAPDRDSMAAAATLAARLGLAAGRAIPFPEALAWFKRAIARGGDAMVAHGLAHTLRELGFRREAEDVAYAWREPLVNNTLLFIDLLESDLTRAIPPAIEPERLKRYGQVTAATASGEGAQALAWYAYNNCQFDVALGWFKRAMAWFPKQDTAYGYALTLRRLHQQRAFIETVNRYDGLFPKVVDLLFQPPSDHPMPCEQVPAKPVAQPVAAVRSSGYLDLSSSGEPAPGRRWRVPGPEDLGAPAAIAPPVRRNDFPIAVQMENDLRVAPTGTPDGSAAELRWPAHAMGRPSTVARRVPGVGAMPYERFGFSLKPGWNGEEAASAPTAAEKPAPIGTLWSDQHGAANARSDVSSTGSIQPHSFRQRNRAP